VLAVLLVALVVVVEQLPPVLAVLLVALVVVVEQLPLQLNSRHNPRKTRTRLGSLFRKRDLDILS
jgi:hypothetical protein